MKQAIEVQCKRCGLEVEDQNIYIVFECKSTGTIWNQVKSKVCQVRGEIILSLISDGYILTSLDIFV